MNNLSVRVFRPSLLDPGPEPLLRIWRDAVKRQRVITSAWEKAEDWESYFTKAATYSLVIREELDNARKFCALGKEPTTPYMPPEHAGATLDAMTVAVDEDEQFVMMLKDSGEYIFGESRVIMMLQGDTYLGHVYAMGIKEDTVAMFGIRTAYAYQFATGCREQLPKKFGAILAAVAAGWARSLGKTYLFVWEPFPAMISTLKSLGFERGSPMTPLWEQYSAAPQLSGAFGEFGFAESYVARIADIPKVDVATFVDVQEVRADYGHHDAIRAAVANSDMRSVRDLLELDYPDSRFLVSLFQRSAVERNPEFFFELVDTVPILDKADARFLEKRLHDLNEHGETRVFTSLIARHLDEITNQYLLERYADITHKHKRRRQ